jgi:sulfur-carrier protein adenylyltransferase/sulfurtransferase
MTRYSRHIQLSEIGTSGQEKISNAKVLVVGAGGLGCPVLQYLAAAGVGNLGIIDFDVVEESNLQRQVLFGTSSLGMNKAIAAKLRLEDLNPTITLKAYPDVFTAENAISLCDQYDIIVDGSDNMATRYLINDVAILCDKPVVYGAIYKFEGQVSVFNYMDGPSYRCLFPTPPKNGSIANCSDIGVLGVLPGIIGSMQANEVLKMILGLKGILSGKLLCYQAQTGQTTLLSIPKMNQESKARLLRTRELPRYDETACSDSIPEISTKDALLKKNAIFIDVREYGETPELNVPNGKQIPWSELQDRLDEFHTQETYIIFCTSGIRSRKAVELLQQHFDHPFYNLKEGAAGLLEPSKIQHE